MGAILFELLTEERAQPLETRRAVEMERVICETPPPVPSTTTEGRRRKLDTDLDVVVQKAMHKDVTRRYRSVLELESDIARQMDGRPLLAKPDTWRYRTRRFVGRNKYKVASAALFGLLLVGFAITMAVQASRIAKERDAATAQAAIRGEISDFLVDLFEIADPGETRADLVRARDLLDKGSNRIANELKSGPVVRAGLMEAMGRAYVALGLYADAEPLLQSALAIREETGNEEMRARTWLAIALLRAGTAQLDEARAAVDQAKLAMDNRSQTGTQLDVKYHQIRARLAWEVGDPDEAVDQASRAHELLVELHGPKHIEVANALTFLGSMRVERGDFDGAERDIEAGTAMRRDLFGAEHVETARDLRILGDFRNASGKSELALEAYRAALAIDEKLYGPNHPDRASDTWGIATALIELGKAKEGINVLEALIATEREHLGEHPHVALTMRELASIVGSQGLFDRSEQLFEACLTIERARLPADHPQTATTLANFGSMLHRKGELDRALPLISEALEMRKRLYPPDHSAVLASFVQSALGHYYSGDYAKAESIYREALAVRRQRLGVHPETAGTLYGVSIALHAQDKNEEAIPLLIESLEILAKTVAPEHLHNARSLALLGKIYLEEDRMEDAEDALRKALHIHEQFTVPSHPTRVSITRRLAWCLGRQERQTEARELIETTMAAIDPQSRMAEKATLKLRETLDSLPD